ncbi:MAG: hypothetical protein M1828_001119 [Chrysothrix sp. TS-e1954]|nr:MAG: hypothetical protein M1828_001119 [Chrysothrix sp. TS-e1954]
MDDPFVFPKPPLNKVPKAMWDLTEAVMEIHGSPAPDLKWAYVNMKSRMRNARAVKEQHITQHIEKAVRGLECVSLEPEQKWMRSATDQVIWSEEKRAKKEGRRPDYFSRTIMDELFGLIFAGASTTGTTLSWMVKFLTDNHASQDSLRSALRTGFSQATEEDRDPTVREIIGTRIPYLDATIEESLRCASTSPFLDRQATVDTQLLGRHVPRGTVVLCLLGGPSMMSPAFEIDEDRPPSSTKTRNAGSERRHGRSDGSAWPHDDLAAFRPERWLNRGDGDAEHPSFDPTKAAHLAFGMGARACFGKRAAYLTMRIFVVLLCWRFELLPCPPRLSSYTSDLRTANEPRQCFLRLRRIDDTEKQSYS